MYLIIVNPICDIEMDSHLLDASRPRFGTELSFLPAFFEMKKTFKILILNDLKEFPLVVGSSPELGNSFGGHGEATQRNVVDFSIKIQILTLTFRVRHPHGD